MTEFKVGDLVRVISQNKNFSAPWVDDCGYIDEIEGDYAIFVELKEGGYGGSGEVPLSCLKLENDNVELQLLKISKDSYLDKYKKDYQELSDSINKEYDAALSLALEETGVCESKIITIFSHYQNFINKRDNALARFDNRNII